MKAVNKGPGEIYAIGFDTSPAVMDAFEKGYAQITSDQQPFLQGYLPILSLCLQKKYGMAPITFDTGAGFVDSNNYKNVMDLANQGIR
jgi:simple sugar transport system substrate-binding protein